MVQHHRLTFLSHRHHQSSINLSHNYCSHHYHYHYHYHHHHHHHNHQYILLLHVIESIAALWVKDRLHGEHTRPIEVPVIALVIYHPLPAAAVKVKSHHALL